MDKQEEIKEIIYKARENGLLFLSSYYYADKNGEIDVDKVKEVIKVLKDINRLV
tara:strand:+ start:243 stop:404 length:162 start_codon:yes stop_codon:yes gene_type:complete